ncbi:MAG TPA: UDP-N-acetylmuramoyl-L-alanine--D-glutamate ligase, partial [Acidimicrobiales bacterium]
VEAIDRDVDAFVVECSSFRLAFTDTFRAEAAVWLNLAPDHQDWHPSMTAYEEAKHRVWSHQTPGDAAIGNALDAAVMRRLQGAPGRHVTFGAERADYRVEGGDLVGPLGVLAPIAAMTRALPHDLTNALAAAAGVLEAGVGTVEGVAAGLAAFTAPRHRIELVASADGIDWYDDSKATTPHAAVTAVRGFERVVLLAGGRNKGLDLAPLAEVADRIRAVVALGETAPEVAKAFAAADRPVPVEEVGSMADAVDAARRLAHPGDAVLLSPACASFDWYSGYGERGDDFARLVHELLGGVP